MALVDSACAAVGVNPTDLAVILQVGDAEPQRTAEEAAQVIGPAKYRKLGDFEEVISGCIVVPAPLFFIAGNHEPYAALDANGGWANGAGEWGPNVTYLGRSGVCETAGLRIGFLSGIYGESWFRRSESRQPIRRQGRNAAHYSVQELAMLRAALGDGVDVLVTHDWPTGIAEVGHFGPVGDERIRALIEDFQPMLSIHGHMHIPASAMIGGSKVECLAIVGYRGGDPIAAVGIWNVDPATRSAIRLK